MDSVTRIFKWCLVCEKCTEHELQESMKWLSDGRIHETVCKICLETYDYMERSKMAE